MNRNELMIPAGTELVLELNRPMSEASRIAAQ
jgi:hypothetical protein